MHSNAIQKAAEVTAAPAEAVSAEELRLINTYTRRNMAFLVKSIALGKEQYGLPVKEEHLFTNFIR